MKNSNFLKATFSIENVSGEKIPMQNGIVVPSFEPQERKQLSLSGEWKKVRINFDNEKSMTERNEIFIKEEFELINEKFNNNEVINLPSPENKMNGEESIDGIEYFEGGVAYKRNFKMDSLEKTKILKLLSVSYVCDIWINGSWIGYHEGGYTPFAFDITKYLKNDNEIIIRVDNPPWGSRMDLIPATATTDFFNYTGVIHDLYIEEVESTYIPRVDIFKTDLEGNIDVSFVLSSKGLNKNVKVTYDIYEADKNKYKDSESLKNICGNLAEFERKNLQCNLSENENKKVSFNFKIDNPKIWDVFQPNLYVAKFNLLDENDNVLDTLYTQFGIRTVKVEGRKILLNDKLYFPHGIARHEEWPLYGRTASWDRIVKDFDQMVDLNVNFIRTGHCPNHIYANLYLDRIGIPSMSEIPLWQMEKEHFHVQEEKRLTYQMFREMVFSRYNSASILLWSTQNECKGCDERLLYNQTIVDDLRNNYNDSRLIAQSAAADQPGGYDKSVEPLDVAGFTMYFGIFHGGTHYNGTKRFIKQCAEYYNKPILNTEYGYWSGDEDIFEEEQLEIYEQNFKAFMDVSLIDKNGNYNENGILSGINFWTMYNWYVNHNRWIDTFGIYRMDRKTAKIVAEQIKEDYGKLL